MKNTLSLSVAKPCHERWEQFTPTSQGGYCTSCRKHVTDFTKMSDEEITDFFKNNTTQNCGRFRPDQLRVYTAKNYSATNSGRNLIQAGFLSVLLFFVNKEGHSQSLSKPTPTHFAQPEGTTKKDSSVKSGHTIRGTVKDEYNQSIPGVSVYLKGTTVGTATNENGTFEFPQALQAGDVLIFNFIGYETKEYVVAKNAPPVIEIALITLRVEIMGEVLVDSPYTAKATGLRKGWQKLKSLF
jgi:hypothetical protein